MLKLRTIKCFAFFLLAILASAAAHGQPRGQTRKAKPASKQVSRAANLVDEADKLSEEKKWSEAIDVYKIAIRLDSNYEDAYAGLGDSYLNIGKWDEALSAYKEQIRVAPNSPNAHYNLGYAYNRMGRHGEAFAPLVKAVSLDPQFAEAHYGIGFAYMRGQEFEKAVGFLKSAIRLKPDYAEAIYGLGSVLARLGNFDAADAEQRTLAPINSRLAAQLDKDIQKARLAAANERANESSARVGNNPATPPAQTSQQSNRSNPDHSAAAVTGSATASQTNSPSPSDAKVELAFWESIRSSKDPADYRAYLQKFPNGVFVDLARRRAGQEEKVSGVKSEVAPAVGNSVVPRTSQPAAANANTQPASSQPITSDRSVPASANVAADRLGKGFGLKAGISTRADAASALGPPARDVNASMVEYNPQPGTGKIYVEYQSNSPIVSRIEVYLPAPVLRADMLMALKLSDRPQEAKPDSKGRLVEYFGAPRFMALAHVAGEATSGINRIGYFSEALFNEALGRPQPQANDTMAANPSGAIVPKSSDPSNPQATTNNLSGSSPANGVGLPPSIAAATSTEAAAEKSWTIPANTIVFMRINNGVSSKRAKANDIITAVVSLPITIEGRTLVAAGTLVEGRVTQAKPAGRMGKPGMIAIDFGEIVFKNSSRVKLIGTLTAANADPKHKIDPEGSVKAKNKGPQPGVVIAGGAGLGAVIGGASGGGAGAGIGAAGGAGVGIAASLLMKGPEAELKPGFPFGIQLSKPAIVSESNLREANPQ